MSKATKRRLHDVSDIILKTPRKSKMAAIERMSESKQENVSFNTIGTDVTREIFLLVLNNTHNLQKCKIPLVCKEWKKIYDSMINERLEIFLKKAPLEDLRWIIYLRSLELGIMDSIVNEDDQVIFVLCVKKGKVILNEETWIRAWDDYCATEVYDYKIADCYRKPKVILARSYNLRLAILVDKAERKKNPTLSEALELYIDFPGSYDRNIRYEPDRMLYLPERKSITPELKQTILEINHSYKLF